MKKIICLLAIIAMLCTCAACAQKEKSDPLKDFLNSTQSDVSSSTGDNATDKEESSSPSTPSETQDDPSENKDVFSILNLKPTHKEKDDLQFTLANGLGINTDFTIPKNSKDYYSYLYNSLPQKYSSWGELKNIKFKNVAKSTYSGYYTISLMTESENMKEVYNSYITCVFDVNDENMTIGKAYDEKMYHYVLASENDQYYEDWMSQLASSANCETALEAVIKTLGMPSSVHYTDFQNHATFDIVYKLNDKALIFTGYEKFEDFTDNKDRLVIQSIAVSGINSTNYIVTIEESENRISLK